jgi:hypothetical protein
MYSGVPCTRPFPGQAVIDHFHVPAAIDHDIVRFEVGMVNAAPMHLHHPFSDLDEDANQQRQGNARESVQGSAVDILY